MSNYTSFEVSEKLWKAGLRPEEGHKTSIHHKDGVIDHIYGYKSIVGIDETIEETRLFPCYTLSQLVKEIEKHCHWLHIEFDGGNYNLDALTTFGGESTEDVFKTTGTTIEDAAGELLVKILEAKG